MKKNQFIIPDSKTIPYNGEVKRTFSQKMRKIKNTLLMYLACILPIPRLRVALNRWRGVHIGENVYIGLFCLLDNLYPEYIYIEDCASINAGSVILTHFNPMKCHRMVQEAQVAPVYIKEKAIVAVRSIILPGVVIGTQAIVSAGTVVDKEVPDFTIVKGNPMKKVVNYEKLVNLQKTELLK